MAQIKRQYTNPVPILYLCKGYPETSLVSKDISSATEITLNQQMNEVATLTFKVPFTKDRKISPNDCEKLVKFEGEYYIIKSIRLDDENTRKMTVSCQHESTELKGVYCSYLNLIGASPKEMFNTIIASTKTPSTIDYKWAGTDVPINKFRHLQTDDEQSVYANLIAMAEVFNGWLEIYTDKNEQKWVFLRTQEIKNNKLIRKGIDMKSLGITYDSSDIFTQLQAFGGADSVTGEKLNIMGVNPTQKSYVENYSYYLAKGIPKEVIDSEPKYQQLKVVTEDNYTDENDLFEFAKEELEKCCKPKLEATVNITDLSVYMDNPTIPPMVGYELICIDSDIGYNLSCKITGVERNYSNPADTKLTIANVVNYNTLLQDISHTVDKANSVIGDDKNGAYVSDTVVKDANGTSVSVKINNMQSTMAVEFNNIKLRVDDFEKDVYAEIKLTAEKIEQTVADNKQELSSKIEQTSEQISSTVTRLNQAESKIQQNANEISSKVSEGDFGTLIRQNSKSVKMSWNNISNYVEIDSSGLTLGNPDRGTYSQIGSDGRLTLCTGTGNKKYHCLSFTQQNIDIKTHSEKYEVKYVDLPREFWNLNQDEITVSCSTMKVWKDGSYIPYWFGAYAYVTGDCRKIKIEAMSTWKEYNDLGGKNKYGHIIVTVTAVA